MSFRDTSQTFGCAVTGWVWDFDDGTSTSTLQHPTHTFQNSGQNSVELTVTGPFGSVSHRSSGYIKVTGN